VDVRRRAVLILGVWGAMAAPGRAANELDPRLTPRERADLLEPWALEPRPGEVPMPVPPVLPVPPAADVPTDAEIGSPATEQPSPSPSPSDGVGVEIVRCRQLTIGQPARAERLAALLQSGADLETARRAVGGADIVERTREYVLDDLEPDIRAEIASLPEGGWSRVRTTRGRATIFQVVAKSRRDAATLPELGAGLGQEEQARLQATLKPRPAPVRPVQDETRDAEAAAVVTQVQPEYPQGATTSGEVTVLVRIGRADDVINAEVQSSTDPQFNDAALRAARRSTYRAARTDGIPSVSTVTVTFKFVAPAQAGQDPTQPPPGTIPPATPPGTPP
jgi:TonB family protein